jgi:hypothetical protein
MFSHLRPNPNRGDMDSNVSFQVGCSVPQMSPSVVSKGITSMLVGARASLIILDDVETPNNSATPQLREKLATALEEIGAILLPKTASITPQVKVLGTPQTEMTVYKVLERRGYKMRIWPIQLPNEKRRLSYGDRLSPFVANMPGIEGDPTEPSRFGVEEIASRRAEYGA